MFSSYSNTCSHVCSLACSLFISNDEKRVSKTLIKTFMSSDLVFDGRLLIDEDFRTNDPNIYAAGPLTRYKRSLYADQFAHQYYNSVEIGRVLGLQLLQKYTNELIFKNDCKKTVFRFTKPIIKRCILPGPFNYLSVVTPGVIIPFKLSKLLGYNVCILYK